MRTLFVILSLLLPPLCLFANDVKSMPQEPEHQLIPRSELFASPSVACVRLNREGSHIAYLAPSEDGILNVWVSPIDDLSNPAQYTFETQWPIRSLQWTYVPGMLIYSQDNNGDEQTQLFLLNIVSGKKTPISDPDCVSQIVGLSEREPQTLVFSTNNRDPRYFDLWHYNIPTQTATLAFINTRFNFLMTDHDLKMSLGGLMLSSGDMDVFYMNEEQWEHVLTIEPESLASFNIIGFGQDNKSFIYTGNNYSDKAMLYRYDFLERKSTALAKSDDADVFTAYLHPRTFDVEAYAYEYERLNVVVVDKQFQDSWSWLNNEIPGDLWVTSRSMDNNKWVVHAFFDNKPSDYLLFNCETKKLEFLFNTRPELKSYPLEPMQPFILEARDSLKLVSYLTVPDGISLDDNLNASKPSPLVILVHGGPVGVRDSWGFSPTTQFLANRGYAVLSINYRGSGGFGREFIDKSFGQWSKNMQTDLLDGMEWAINHGITTRDSVAIMGGSYGGYAALVGLAITPDIFACGIDIVGPSNMETLLETMPSYWKPSVGIMRKKLGLPEDPAQGDKKYLASISPLSYAHQINKPLLIMHGANDPRVKQAESEQIVAVLRDNHTPFVYALFPDEGHGFALQENRIAANAITEVFLADIFGTPSEPLGDSLRKSSVIIQGVDD